MITPDILKYLRSEHNAKREHYQRTEIDEIIIHERVIRLTRLVTDAYYTGKLTAVQYGKAFNDIFRDYSHTFGSDR